MDAGVEHIERTAHHQSTSSWNARTSNRLPNVVAA